MVERGKTDWERALAAAVAGKRLGLEEGVALFHCPDLTLLGQAASIVRRRFHPEKVVTFIIDRNINYTNVCICRCRFCAFYRDPGHPEAYVLSQEEIFQKIEETIAAGGTQILMQGGLHPDLPFEFYLDLLREIKKRYNIHIHSFSAPEIYHFSRISGLSIEEVLRRLKDAGLDSIPGGGAEILDNRVRHAISPRKITWEQWMEVMTTAHRLGMKTTATMMFGSLETVEERVLHLLRIREVQDETGGFTAFIPWTFQPGNTELEEQFAGVDSGGFDYLRTLAISRLLLDNIPNIQASWVTQGAKMAQVSLAFGANDFGSTMLEENVVRATGVCYRVPMDEIIRCIKDAGYRPAQRDTYYRIIRYFD